MVSIYQFTGPGQSQSGNVKVQERSRRMKKSNRVRLKLQSNKGDYE